MTAEQLRSGCWRRLLRDVYVFAGLPDTIEQRVHALALVLPEGAVLSGSTAAWLYGADIRRWNDPLEITLPRGAPMRPRRGLSIRRAELLPEDVTRFAGLLATTPLRTGLDLARRTGPGGNDTEAVVAVDALTHLGLFTPEELADHARHERFAGWRGIRRAVLVAEQAEPASESPGESRLRMKLVRAGLPRPEAQINLFAPSGRHVARLDLGYREQRIAVEYDGVVHRERWREDAARRNAVKDLGWDLYVCTQADLHPANTAILAYLRRELSLPRRS
ncbi:hypothetical protein [Actinorugispora endophytica]|uniref:Transcriptional regulator with AbiEi antitoxin domain of type IV toxin-antitoxin system n=1 Tax=Actinorugispora endophytica TaxID=1605990 RepID=A0A4R6V9F5_9ACTN|nr:hypothetical protein [Actinorugispora endophytica]TDQ53088.1 transcriptional regulator with AbiEi antitoxin domain of type IV toxin-antitoxin system [Actinorugispora endophytica]